MWKKIKISKAELSAYKRFLAKKAKFLIDEDIDPELAEALCELKYNTVTVADIGLKGRTDEDVLAFAKRKNRILITIDKDFKNERRFPEHRNNRGQTTFFVSESTCFTLPLTTCRVVALL